MRAACYSRSIAKIPGAQPRPNTLLPFPRALPILSLCPLLPNSECPSRLLQGARDPSLAPSRRQARLSVPFVTEKSFTPPVTTEGGNSALRDEVWPIRRVCDR